MYATKKEIQEIITDKRKLAKTKLNITLEDSIKKLVLAEASKLGMSASAFITMLILSYKNKI